MTSQIKTMFLLALLSGLVLALGGALGGRTGVMIVLVPVLLMNVASYWYSDKIVLSMYRAQELAPEDAPLIHRMVEDLARQAGVPTPRLYSVPQAAPNAFATGRDPAHAVIAVTEGIVRLLSPEELRGVLAHEMSHIANRDILIQSVAGVLAAALTGIASLMRFGAIFGRSSNSEGGGNALAVILLSILAPIAAGFIQMAISRSREYLADATGASISGQPLALAGALAKLDAYSRQIPMAANPATENMFIVSPLAGTSFASLFSTHPPIQERIARLQEMARR